MMINLRINKIVILMILTLLLITFGCSNGLKNQDNNLNKLEYLGYMYLENQVKVYFKNYSVENYLITLNSVAPNEENLEDGITELTFLNNGNNNSSLKILNNINSEENLISKALLNPEENYKQVLNGQEFLLKINEIAFEKSTNSIIKLIDVAEDSRCPDPTDNNETLSNPGTCIHEPKTLIHIIIETPKFKTFDEFIYKEQLSDYEFFYGGNYVNISKIEPDIGELNRLIPDSDYVITLSLTSKD